MNPIDMITEPHDALTAQRDFETRMGVPPHYQTTVDALFGPAVKDAHDEAASLRDALRSAENDAEYEADNRRAAEATCVEARKERDTAETANDKAEDDLYLAKEEIEKLRDRIGRIESEHAPGIDHAAVREAIERYRGGDVDTRDTDTIAVAYEIMVRRSVQMGRVIDDLKLQLSNAQR